MSSQQKHREEFVGIMATEGVPVDVARKVMRHATTLHRLAEMECNGYGWEDHFKRKPCPSADTQLGETFCPECQGYGKHDQVTSGTLYLVRKDRQVTARIAALVAPYGVKAEFQGDPRGPVVSLLVPSGRNASYGGIAVP